MCLLFIALVNIDIPILIFLTLSPLFVKLTDKYKIIAVYIDKIIIMISTFCFILDHYSFDPNHFELHIRCYIFLAGGFSFALLQSDSWLKTSIVFLVSQVILIIGLGNHFKVIPSELYAVIFAAWIFLSITAYQLENNSR